MIRVTTKLVWLALAAAACGGTTAPVGSVGNTGSGGAANADRSIRTVDWSRFTYDTGEDGRFTVAGGTADFVFDDDGATMTRAEFARRHPGVDPTERGSFSVEAPVFGDVDRDGVEDAVITSSLWGGGTGHFTNVWIYRMRDGAPVVLGSIPGGDRAEGGIAGVAVASGGAVLVSRYETDGGACCPERVAHEVWRWNGAVFAQDVDVRRVEAL